MTADEPGGVARSAGRSAVDDHIARSLTASRRGTRLPARGLPVAHLVRPARNASLHLVVTTVDGRGRLADRSPLRMLGWTAGQPVAVSLAVSALVIVVRAGGSQAITGQGHLRLPVAIRRVCRLETGDRVLVVACPQQGLLAVYPMATVEEMFLAYHAGVRDEPVR